MKTLANLLTLACALVIASPLHAVPVPSKKPAPADAEQPVPGCTPLTFLKLDGVNPEAGTFSKPKAVTMTKMVPEQRTKTVTVERNGVKQEITQTYTVMVPVVFTVMTSPGVKTHDVYDGKGDRIPADKVFDRLKDGQLVIVSSTPTLPKEYLKLLSPEAIIIAPKREAPVKD